MNTPEDVAFAEFVDGIDKSNNAGDAAIEIKANDGGIVTVHPVRLTVASFEQIDWGCRRGVCVKMPMRDWQKSDAAAIRKAVAEIVETVRKTAYYVHDTACKTPTGECVTRIDTIRPIARFDDDRENAFVMFTFVFTVHPSP